MNNKSTFFFADRLFLATALLMLIGVVIYGSLASVYYLAPGFLKNYLGFSQLRPLHVTSVVFWILMAASGGVYHSFREVKINRLIHTLALAHYTIWFVALVAIFMSYYNGIFGGREYWEFPPKYAGFIAAGWFFFLVSYLIVYRSLKQWSVYHWMWLTGIVCFLFTFFENYLWIFPFVNRDAVKDLTIQWKSNGSLVGSWNQLVYGLAFYLMEKISGDKQTARSGISFAMYFLGLFNLMFNWGHHIYTLPTASYVRIISYAVSMTEWIIFLRIIFLWKKTNAVAGKPAMRISFDFLNSSDHWILLNLFLALLMSIPAINIYTHGTHVTVAHAMGTTIGINTLILLGVSAEIMKGSCNETNSYPVLKRWLTVMNISLGAMLLSLLVVGVLKGVWQMNPNQGSFQQMMLGFRPYFILMFCSGIGLLVAVAAISVVILRSFILCYTRKKMPGYGFGSLMKEG
jgi:nitric oxide reductase subunit B